MDIEELKNFIMSGGSSSDEDDGVCTKRSRKQVNDEDVSFDGFSVGLEFERSEDGDGYIVVGAGFCGDIDLKIPEDYGGLPVVAIGDGAFKGEGELTRVFLPKSVLHIGEQAFAGRMLAMLLDKFGRKAGFQGDLIYQLLIIKV